MHCPVCLASETAFFGRGSDFLFETTDEDFTLHSCRDCRCLFLDPMPGMDRIAAFYPEQYWWDERRGLLPKLEGLYRRFALIDHVRFIAAAAHATPSGSRARILDVGCGPGTLLSLLKKRGFDVAGVDLSLRAVEITRKEHGIDVALGSLEKLSLPAEGFDVVVLLHTLEHVPNPREVLAEVIRVLKPRGRVVVQVPNIDSVQFQFFGARWYGLDVPRHVIDYSRSSLLRLLSESGFDVRRVRHFNLRDNAPALASSLFPGLDPVSRAVRLRQRGSRETVIGGWFRRFVYLKIVLLSYPLAALEAALGRGATLVVEAEKSEGRGA